MIIKASIKCFGFNDKVVYLDEDFLYNYIDSRNQNNTRHGSRDDKLADKKVIINSGKLVAWRFF